MVILCDKHPIATHPLLVFDLPPLGIVSSRLLPLLELGQRVERFRLVALGTLDDERDELLREARHVQQRRPVAMDEVDRETLDVAPIVVLIGRDHEATVPQRLDVVPLVGDVEFETRNIHQVHDFLVLHDLGMGLHCGRSGACARLLAESPSVIIGVQSFDLEVPASFASSSYEEEQQCKGKVIISKQVLFNSANQERHQMQRLQKCKFSPSIKCP